MRLFLVLLLAVGVLTSAASLRDPEYDEAYSLFLTAGDARPAWPAGIFKAGDVRGLYAGRASPTQIAQDLRHGDVHPPLYFWTLEYWRRLAGPSWFAARLLSVLFSLAALAAAGWLAALAELPEVPALLLTLFSYGFAYTGIVARGFALAQLLNILGVALVLAATRKRGSALAGGIALGAASFANYLASFNGLALLAWLLATRNWRALLPATCGFALLIPADLYFFLAQKSSRAGQFNPFSWPHALAALVKDSGAALFGGLPLYAGRLGPVVAAALGLLLCASLFISWQKRSPYRPLFLTLALAPPAGLLALGLLFNNMPIEIRYLAFSLPFLALLLSTLPRLPFLLLLAVQAAGVLGLCLATATMQPQALTARAAAAAAPGALVLLPYGNDGVGIPGPFIAAAPNTMRIQLLRPGAAPDISAATTIALADIEIDAASRTTARAALAQLRADPCLQEQQVTPLIKIFHRKCADSFHKD